jgi:hypothetical protein
MMMMMMMDIFIASIEQPSEALEPVNHEHELYQGHTVGRIANTAPSATPARQIFRNTIKSTMIKPAQVSLCQRRYALGIPAIARCQLSQ